MAENLGAIRYEVEVETASMLKAEAVVNKSMAKNVDAFSKADAAVRNYVSSQKEMGRTVNSMGQVIDKNGDIVASATNKYRALAGEASKGFAALNTEVNKSTKGIRNALGSNLGQAGIQVQQFVGQLQGGQSAMVALAQQSADLGIVLGAPLVGVFVSLAAVLAGTLLPAVFSSTTAIEKMEKAVENTKAVLTLGAYGVANYSDELKNLSTISQELARIKLNTALAEQQKVIQNVGEAAKQAYKKAIPYFNWSFDNSATSTLFGNLVNDKDLERLGSADPLITKARTGIEKLVNAMRTIEKGNTTRGVEQLTDSIDFLSASAVQNTKAGSDLVLQMTKIVEQYKVGKLTIDQLKEALDKSKEGLSGNSEALQSFLQEMHISNTAMLEGERAAIKLKLEYDKLEESQVRTALAAYDYNKSLKDQKEAAEESAKAIKSVNDELDAFFDKENKQSTAKDDRERGQAESFAQGIIDKGMTEPERFAAELEKLEELRQKGLLSQQLYDQAIVASAKSRADQMEKANKQNLQSQRLFTDSQGQLLNSLGGLFGAYADNMEVQDRESFEKKKKFQTAQALINTAMAISNALAAAPPPINFALAAASGAMGAIQVAAIQNQQYSGGRQYGGPVSSGMYRVNETGAPEVYSYGGKDYLMNTKNANIKNLSQGGGGGSQVIVNNNTPYKVYVTQDEAAQITRVGIGEEARKLAGGRGDIARAMQKGFGSRKTAKN